MISKWTINVTLYIESYLNDFKYMMILLMVVSVKIEEVQKHIHLNWFLCEFYLYKYLHKLMQYFE